MTIIKRTFVGLLAGAVILATPIKNVAEGYIPAIPYAQQTPTLAQENPSADSTRNNLNYTQAEVERLARMIYGEAAVCSEKEKIAVAYTVVNRLRNPERYGKDISRILRPSVYIALMNDKKIRRDIKIEDNKETYQECLYIAKQVLEGRVEDPTNGATHFYSTLKSEPPKYWEEMTVIGRVRGEDGHASRHRFYKEI